MCQPARPLRGRRPAGGLSMPRGDFDRSARRAQTRALLLQAAASVYARCGFNGATLDEVAAEAGFTKGAVYDHFGSKENLLLALMEEHLAGQVAEQIELFDRERSTWERPVAGFLVAARRVVAELPLARDFRALAPARDLPAAAVEREPRLVVVRRELRAALAVRDARELVRAEPPFAAARMSFCSRSRSLRVALLIFVASR